MRPQHHDKPDRNRSQIVAALRGAGCEVHDLRGDSGDPDLLVGFLGTLTMIEIKAECGKLSASQRRTHERWGRVGIRVHVVRSERDALEAVGIVGSRHEENQDALRELARPRPAHPRWARFVPSTKLRPSARNYVNSWDEIHDGPQPLSAGKDLSKGPP